MQWKLHSIRRHGTTQTRIIVRPWWCTSASPAAFGPNSRKPQNLKFQLQSFVVTAVNDGGIGFQPNLQDTVYPIIQIEVYPPESPVMGTDCYKAKRKKYSVSDDKPTRQKHAAQIYAEMLAQVCHEEFYGQGEGFQEVSPVLSRLTFGTRHLSCMHDVLQFTYTGPSFRTSISVISACIAWITWMLSGPKTNSKSRFISLNRTG
jgi:hypothetical protein